MKPANLNRSLTSLILFSIFFGFSLQLEAQKDLNKNLNHYVFPSFVEGTVVMKAGNRNKTLLNYHIVTREMIFEENGKRLALIALETIDTVIIEGRKFIPNKKEFFEVAVEAPISLFIEHKGEATTEGTPIGYGAKTQTTATRTLTQLLTIEGAYAMELPDEYHVTNTTLYWIEKDLQRKRFQTKKQFLRIFKDHKSELKQFIKRNKINMKNREDLIKLVEFCNKKHF